jgi:hypothetical protein
MFQKLGILSSFINYSYQKDFSDAVMDLRNSDPLTYTEGTR